MGAWHILFFSWFVSLVATVGSLFFSEVMKFTPCTLCWYQRIFMYPLVTVLLVGMFPLDRNVFRYAMPLAVLGWFSAFYHNLLHFGIIPESAAPCVMGVPCSTVYIKLFGFLTIPMMSFIAFTIIIISLVWFKKRIANEK